VTIREAREILGLELTATRQEITRAYRRAARRWHPDRAPAEREEEYRGRMQQVNAAYHRLRQFLESYRFRLEDTETGEDMEEWWRDRFYTGVWGRPPRGRPASLDEDEATEANPGGSKAGKK
jgi:hypothetical protein